MAFKKFRYEHSSNISKKIPYSIANAQKGMIYEVRYTRLDDANKSYLILILNPKYKFPGEEKHKVHALKLDEFPRKELNIMARKYGVEYIKTLQNTKKLKIPKLTQDMSTKRIYDFRIKKLMDLYSCYRTFFYNEFSQTYLVDYKFDTKVVETYLESKTSIETENNIEENIEKISKVIKILN